MRRAARSSSAGATCADYAGPRERGRSRSCSSTARSPHADAGGRRDFYAKGLRGSKAYVKAHPHDTSEMVLLDYVGNRGLQLPREGSSTAALWRQLRAAARTAGVGSTFPDRTETTILDDHTPFPRAGIPAIDLIDWSYDGHALADTADKLSRRSIDAVGETLVALVRRLDAQTAGARP